MVRRRVVVDRCGGFTLVELVITVAILSILSVVLVAKFSARDQHSAAVRSDQFRRDLSHIQLLAISQGKRLRLTVNSSSYTVTSCTSPGTCNVEVIDPATGQNFQVSWSDGVTLVPDVPILDFDTLGRPVSGVSLIAAVPARTYKLCVSNVSAVNVTVLPITGFASINYVQQSC